MRLLEEDLKILEEKFPGAKDFIRDAEVRYIVFSRMERAKDRQIKGIDPENKALKEKWFIEKISKEDMLLPKINQKKEGPVLTKRPKK